MMRRKVILIMALCMLALLPAHAQKGLQIDSLFNGELVDMSLVTESVVSGKKLSPYNLDYFRSVRFVADDRQIAKVSTWIQDDAMIADDKELESASGQLIYALLRFPQLGSKNKYVGYQVKRNGGRNYVTVVYMEGLATVEDLKVIFKHR